MADDLHPKPKLNWEEAAPAAPPCPAKRRRLRLPDGVLRTAALASVLALLCFCYAGPLTQPATQVIAVKRELPIYSVDRSDNTIAISFDASWGRR